MHQIRFRLGSAPDPPRKLTALHQSLQLDLRCLLLTGRSGGREGGKDEKERGKGRGRKREREGKVEREGSTQPASPDL